MITAAEKRHLARVVALGCIVCKNNGIEDCPATAHHINCGAMGRKASHFEVIGLCAIHHQYSGHGEIAVHDGLESFEARYGTERELLAQVREELGL